MNDTIRADQLEVGRRYTVSVHGQEPRVMTLTEKPSVSISKMTETDIFVFRYGSKKNPREMIFQAHQNKGPRFLHTMVDSKRGKGQAKARVTFSAVPKKVTKVVEEVVKSGRPRKMAA